MNVVLDTNVAAYHLLATEPFCHAAGRFLRAGHTLFAPASWAAELTNVLWLATRHGVLDPVLAEQKLALARALNVTLAPPFDEAAAALALATTHDHPAYDTLSVALARRLKAPLATWDRALLAKFPDVARRPDELA